MQRLVKCIGRAVNSLAVFITQRLAEALHTGEDLFAVRRTEPVILVAQVFPGMPQEQSAVFNLTRCEHDSKNDEARMSNDETMTKHE
jgi:hypothetical protein